MTQISSPSGPIQVDSSIGSPSMTSPSAVDLFADGSDFSDETIDRNRNLYYQQQLATAVSQEINLAIPLLTSMLNVHLNVGQNFTLNTPQVIMSLQPLSSQSLASNQSLSSNGITLPASAVANATDQQSTSTISLQVSLPLLWSSSTLSFPVTNHTTSLSWCLSINILIGGDYEHISQCVAHSTRSQWP